MTTGQGQAPTCAITYDVIRNLTSPSEKENGVQTWFANVPASQILQIGTGDNLRAYIAEHSSSKRNSVHKQIAATIERASDRFINRNSGVTITCTQAVVDDGAKTIKLKNASIINGAQTQGEIKRYFDMNEGEAEDFLLRAEIIMDPSHDAIVEIAIARNTATSVKSVSQANARGHLKELKASVEAALPGEKLQASETDVDGLGTQIVLQQARLLMPPSLLNGKTPPRNLPYKQGGKCLADFSEWASNRDTDPQSKRLHDFIVEIAPIAIKEYRRLESHEAWNGHRLHEQGKVSDKPVGGRAVRRDKKTGKVVWVAPGILFPVMAALSAFVVQKNGEWVLSKPSLFKDEELIRRAVKQFRALNSDVAAMGRQEQAYDALSIYTETIADVLASQ